MHFGHICSRQEDHLFLFAALQIQHFEEPKLFKSGMELSGPIMLGSLHFLTCFLRFHHKNGHKKYILRKNCLYLDPPGRSGGSNFLLPHIGGLHRLLNIKKPNVNKLSRAIKYIDVIYCNLKHIFSDLWTHIFSCPEQLNR